MSSLCAQERNERNAISNFADRAQALSLANEKSILALPKSFTRDGGSQTKLPYL